ncbi:MAG: peptidoglycan-binding domain-containing protein [Desulfobacterales bacterium]|jgi:hypothetical protein
MSNQHDLEDYRLPNLQSLAAPDRFDEVDAILDKANKKGVAAPLPGSKHEVRYKELLESRICTIRTRLYLLGYLKRDNHRPEVDDFLKDAICQFQTEAELEPDGWVGRQTWTALQELVSFEHPSNLRKWFTGSRIKPALLRAIKLRLFVLGFLPSKQAQDTNKLRKALEKFVSIARILKLHDQPLSPDMAFDTINILFDQDGMAAQLAQAGEDFMRHRPADIRIRDARRSIHKFIICCAKIELWLLGYEVSLDGTAKFKIPQGIERFTYMPASYPLFHALYTFWQENGMNKSDALSQATRITGLFFNTLLKIQQQGDPIADPSQSQELYDMLVKEDREVLDQIWGYIKAIGSRIWDGLKRVWRWFKSLLQNVVKKIRTWVKNVARLAYQYALNAFPILKGIVQMTKASASFLLHKTLPDSDIGHIVINRDRDYDYRIYLNPERNYQKVKTNLADFLQKASSFSIGMRVLGLMVSALISVTKSVALAGGWFGLILALLKIYAQLRELVAVLRKKQVLVAVG